MRSGDLRAPSGLLELATCAVCNYTISTYVCFSEAIYSRCTALVIQNLEGRLGVRLDSRPRADLVFLLTTRLSRDCLPLMLDPISQ